MLALLLYLLYYIHHYATISLYFDPIAAFYQKILMFSFFRLHYCYLEITQRNDLGMIEDIDNIKAHDVILVHQ